MSYPPAPLPTSRSNATPQTNTHPADHNAIGLAINDIVATLGTDPTGGAADTTEKLQGLDNSIADIIANTGAALDDIKLINYIGAVDNRDGTGFAISAGSTVVTPDGSGNFTVSFPAVIFSAAPFVFAVNGDPAAANVLISINHVATSTSGFSGHAIFSNTASTPVASGSLRINWIAVGPK